jgi:hypothetical protein
MRPESTIQNYWPCELNLSASFEVPASMIAPSCDQSPRYSIPLLMRARSEFSRTEPVSPAIPGAMA